MRWRLLHCLFAIAAGGALAASGIGAVGSAFLNASIDGTAYIANKVIDGEEIYTSELIFILARSYSSAGEGLNLKQLRRTYKNLQQSFKTAASSELMIIDLEMFGLRKKLKNEVFKSLCNSGYSGVKSGLKRRFNWSWG